MTGCETWSEKIGYESLVIESFDDNIVEQYIRDNFVKIIQEQFKKDNISANEFMNKYFKGSSLDVRTIQRWKNGEIARLKDKYIGYFREMPVIDDLFMSDYYKKFYNEQVSNQEKFFQLKLGRQLSNLRLFTIVSNAVDALEWKNRNYNLASLDEKIDLLKAEIDQAFLDYQEDSLWF